MDELARRSMSPGHPRMRGRVALALVSIVLGGAALAAVEGEIPPPAPARIVEMVDAGHFKQANTAIDAALAAPGLSDLIWPIILVVLGGILLIRAGSGRR